MKLTDFSKLSDAQAAPDVERTEFTSNKMTSYLLEYGLLDEVLNATEGLLRGIKIRIETVSVFDFRDNEQDGLANAALLQILVDGADDTLENEYKKTRYGLLRDKLISDANKTIYPFANTTLVEFNEANNVYTPKEVAGFTQGRDIKITLNEPLPENCIATTWLKGGGFAPKNFGKVEHLKEGISVYELETHNKNARRSLHVHLPFENFDYTVELI